MVSLAQRRVGLVGIFLAGALRVSEAQLQSPTDAGNPSANEIVARMLEKNKQRLVALERYTTERTYRVDYRGTGGHREAEIRVHAEYTAPEQKRLTVVSESGSKFLRDKVLRKLVESEEEASGKSNRLQMSLSEENYVLQVEGEETLNGIRAWVLKVAPKVASKFTYRGRVWVSEDDYAVMRVAGEPAKNPSWWINHASFDSRYMRRGDVWVPQRNVSSSHVRIGGDATLTIDYGEYEVQSATPLKRGTDQPGTTREDNGQPSSAQLHEPRRDTR
jgi:hypothetical protein